MGRNFYEGVKNPTKLLLWGRWLSCCLLFLDMWDESDLNCSQTGRTVIERGLFFDKSIPCWELSAESTSDGCFLLCVKMHQVAIAGKRLFDPFHVITSSITTSAGFSVVFSLDWRQQFFDMRSSFFTLPGFSRQTRKNIIFSSLQYLWRAFPISVLCIYLLSASAELEREEGWETTKHIRPNYSASIRAFLSSLGYSLLAVWIVWLTERADSKTIALFHINAPTPNPSSLGQPGPRGQPSLQGSSLEGQCRLSPLSLFLRGWWGKGFKTPHPFLLSLTHFVWFSVVVERNIMDLLGSVLHNVTVDFDGQ